MVDVVEFEIGEELYAMDIQLAREIVEMVPITPLPRAPEYISGIINLRGEITTVLTINELIGIKKKKDTNAQKIIILVPEASGGSNVGIIVDDVLSVIQVARSSVEQIEGAISAGGGQYIKGIIKTRLDTGEKIKKSGESDDEEGLVLWLDIEKILKELVDIKD
ncbi:MAG TPA: chemotaxis protein CheW [Methanoregulaceae archaeon]|nr:chemotaxis protein CheW [Methanoregulaceae archaeon]